MTIRVLIVDDSPTMRAILMSRLSGESDISVIGTASNAMEGRELIKQFNPIDSNYTSFPRQHIVHTTGTDAGGTHGIRIRKHDRSPARFAFNSYFPTMLSFADVAYDKP